jgi:hypothetical protein
MKAESETLSQPFLVPGFFSAVQTLEICSRRVHCSAAKFTAKNAENAENIAISHWHFSAHSACSAVHLFSEIRLLNSVWWW